jgi:hypothetical protein
VSQHIDLIADLGGLIAAAKARGDEHAAATLRATIGALVDSSELIAKAERRRAKDRNRKRGVPADSTDSAESAGIDGIRRTVSEREDSAPDPSPPSPSLFSPTPPINPSSSAPPRSTSITAREDRSETALRPPPGPDRERLLARLSTDRCRSAVAAFLDAVPIEQNPRYWVAELAGWLEGLNMPRLQPPDEEDITNGLAEYSRLTERDYSPRHVRTFVVQAKADRIRLAERENPGLATGRRHLNKEQRRARDEREDAQQQELKVKWMQTETRRQRADGEEWWARMKREAAAAGDHVIAYAYARLDERADVGSAPSGTQAA